jgi:hypothetical protein
MDGPTPHAEWAHHLAILLTGTGSIAISPHLALAADDRVRGGDQERPTELAAKQPGRRPYLPPGGGGKLQAMANPVYGTDLVTLTVAIVLAAGIVFLLAQLVPQLLA